MTTTQLRQKYLDFFRSKDHNIIDSASLIPENDPTVLFTTAGMHPLVPYLSGQKHPSGQRLANVQKCIRTGDIDDVGDDTHLSLFEMLGNWSLGDYFKQKSIEYSFEFLTSPDWLNIPLEKLAVTVFAGDQDAPRDQESADIWQKLGFPSDRIFFLPKKDNWWGPAGKTGPCGPDTEIFYILEELTAQDIPGESSKMVEIWNNVFMEYNKKADGSFEFLTSKNVDTGMGVERTTAILNGYHNVYQVDTLSPLVDYLSKEAKVPPTSTGLRIIADHLRTATFIIGDQRGVLPGKSEQGYVLRKLIRRAIREAIKLNLAKIAAPVGELVIDIFKDAYPELKVNKTKIIEALVQEEAKFSETLVKGKLELDKLVYLDLWSELKLITKLSSGEERSFQSYLKSPQENRGQIELLAQEKFESEMMFRKTLIQEILSKTSDKSALINNLSAKVFNLYETYGLPWEVIEEEFSKFDLVLDQKVFSQAFKVHQQRSKQASESKFKGGLLDHSVETTKLHTATHLLQAALRKVLGDHIQQKGSNITAERLRFDFNHPQKVTKEELLKVEALVNQQIKANLAVSCQEMSVDEAKQRGAIGLFPDKYQAQVKVYQMGGFSQEICGGPHVEETAQLGVFKIKKEQSVAAGTRRIKAVLKAE